MAPPSPSLSLAMTLTPGLSHGLSPMLEARLEQYLTAREQSRRSLERLDGKLRDRKLKSLTDTLE